MADELEHEDFEIDFRRLKDDHLKAGYVEGLQAGEESSLQQGFNDGFTNSVSIVLATSKLLGSISAVLSYLKSKKNQDNSELTRRVMKIKSDVEALEQRTLNEYEMLVTQQDSTPQKYSNAVSINEKTLEYEAKCSGGDTENDITCCSKNDAEMQVSSCGTNCCSENVTEMRTKTEQNDTKFKTPSLIVSRVHSSVVLETFHKDVEELHKQLTHIHKEILNLR